MLEIQGVLIPPLCKGRAMPNDENQVKSGCRVRNTIAQNIHLVKLPPIANAVVPSCRKATPASTNDNRAADGASRSNSEMTSFSNCGVGIAFNLACSLHDNLQFCWQPSAFSNRSAPSCPYALCTGSSLGHTTGSVCNPELDEPRDSGNGQKSGGGEQPAPKPTSSQPGDNGSQDRAAGSHGSDYVPDPVDEVEKGALWLGARLALNGHVGSRSRAQVLRPRKLCEHEERKSQPCPEFCFSHIGSEFHRDVFSFLLAASNALVNDSKNDRRAWKVG